MSNVVVMKFGGTSVADADCIRRAARRAIQRKQDGQDVVMVVSAMGKTTDSLISLAGEISEDPPKREMDMLLTTGEQVSISLMAMAIHNFGQEAISLTGGQTGLLTDRAHSKARIQKIDDQRLRSELAAGKIVIVAGFQGIDEAGEITTLGRGASDTTAVALAAVLGAEFCEIYTDVDGVYTADPRLIPNACMLKQISYDEMLEMASLGAGVMASRAVEFGKKYNVKIHVRSSFSNNTGTWITQEAENMEQIVVSGATLMKNLAQFDLRGVSNVPGVVARIFQQLATHNVIVDDIIQTAEEDGKASCSFTAGEPDAKAAQLALEELKKDGIITEIQYKAPVAKVSVVGVGMRSHTGVAQKMFAALGEAKVNINSITTSEIKISCLIDTDQAQQALQVVHDAFELSSVES